MQESSQAEEKATAEAALSAEYAAEMTKWVDLTNRLSAQIAALRNSDAGQTIEPTVTVVAGGGDAQLAVENARLREENRALKAQLQAACTQLEPSLQEPRSSRRASRTT